MFNSAVRNEQRPHATALQLGVNWLRRAGASAAAVGERMWAAHRTDRALRRLSDEQREDCGIDRPDVPTTTRQELAAQRKLSSRMPAEWC